MDDSKVAKTVCHLGKSGGGKKFTSDNGRYSHFINSIKEAHRLYEPESPKWNEFFTEYSSLNVTDTIRSIEHALAERNRIIDSFKLKRKVQKNSAYAFQLFLGASECFAPDWKKSKSDRKKWEEYFSVCEKWARTYFPNKVLSVAVHYDEKVPHMHVNLIPIRENMPIYHNEKIRGEDGSFLLNKQGKIKTRKVMTVDEHGEPILETKYTSGNFMNPEELVLLQTNFALAVESFGVVRGVMNSNSRHEDLRESTRIHARKLKEEEERLKNVESTILERNNLIEKKVASIKHLLEVPFSEFKIVEPERKTFSMLYNWELNGVKCKSFEEFRVKTIEDQVAKRLYQANLIVQNKEKHVSVLSNELAKQQTINQSLELENSKLKKLVLNAPFEDLVKLRQQREMPNQDAAAQKNASVEPRIQKRSR